MKAKNYKLKYVPTKEQLIEAHFREGGSWINCLKYCVEQYNEFMDSFDFLCEVTDMEDKKYCPLCYGLSDTATSSKTLMCSEEKCMWWQDGDCICNTAVKLLGLLANSRAYLKSAT